MRSRQSFPRQWLIVDHQPDDALWRALRRLPHDSGVLILQPLSPRARRHLRHLAALYGLTVVTESSGAAARVHNTRELRKALLARTSLILLSPIHATRSHPGWRPLHRMRSAALTRLAGRNIVALGGMNQNRYAKIAQLGFIGWAGISAFRT